MQFAPSRRSLLTTAALLPLAGAPLGRQASAATRGDHYERAARLAGHDPVLLNLVKALTPGSVPAPAKPPKPLRLFDDVAVVSVGSVSATAILTSGGVVLIDALDTPEEARTVIVPGLRSLGVDPATIRYVVVTHGHSDHFGGAQYLADHYGARVMMSAADRKLAGAKAPKRFLNISDGQRLTLGDTTITLHLTPGHTPGTVSPIFPVRWKGRRHTAMLWGGLNPPAATADKRVFLASIAAFATRMRRAGVDVELMNHQQADLGLQRMEQLRAGAATNPFVIGQARAQRFMGVMAEMMRGRIATDLETGGK